MRTDHQREIELKSYHRRARRYRALGLNSRGKAFGRTPPVDPAQRPANNRKNWLANWKRRAARFAAEGLNSRGQPFARADKTADKRLRVMLGNFSKGQRSAAARLKGV